MNHSTGRKGRALLSVHDVTPGCLSLLTDILGDLADRGISAVNLAIVPRFHGEDSWSDAAAFRKAVAAPGVRTEVMLHGYFHARTGENERLPWPLRFRSRLQSDREDEFFCLGAREAEERIRSGARILEAVLGRRPRAFVPPAWSGNKALRGILRRLGFFATEDHFWIYDLENGRRIPSPVIAFSTRSPRRERLSTLWARLVRRVPLPGTVLRFAVHPSDYSSPAVRALALKLVAEISANYDWRLSGEIPEPIKERSYE